jgi:hypothetical protein
MENHEKKKTEAVLRCFGFNTTQAREIVAMVENPAQGKEELVEQVSEYQNQID